MWRLSFPTNEHAYQYRKSIEIWQAPNPRRAQLLAKDICTDDRWVGLKQGVMYELLQEKFRQCPSFRHDLVETNDALLIEDTSHDYWGRGSSGNGLNVLGRLLMTLRQNPPPENIPSMSHPSGHRSSLYPSPSVSSCQVHCFNCGEKSHTFKSCRHSTQLRCYSCSELGHKRKFCPKQINHH